MSQHARFRSDAQRLVYFAGKNLAKHPDRLAAVRRNRRIIHREFCDLVAKRCCRESVVAA